MQLLTLSCLQISSQDHSHLNDLSQVRFLVIDEADRMVQQGSFQELTRIMDAVEQANPMDDDDDEEDIEEEDTEQVDRLFHLPGVPGEARLTMLSDDILERLEEQRTGVKSDKGKKPKVAEVDDAEYEKLETEQDEMDTDGYEEDEISLPAAPPVYRQTFVYSATLCLPTSAKYVKSQTDNAKIDGAIAEILEKSRARGKTKVVDLTHSTKQKKKGAPKETEHKVAEPAAPKDKFRLPPGLSLQQVKCTQLHKDSHLYAYLMTTKEGSSGPCLVFCNSIAAVRRIGATLEALGIQARILHASMQQVREFVIK
jgi:ATP-dependent RNA helicase DDX24/MAK5